LRASGPRVDMTDGDKTGAHAKTSRVVAIIQCVVRLRFMALSFLEGEPPNEDPTYLTMMAT
jgi:hypothetical protein